MVGHCLAPRASEVLDMGWGSRESELLCDCSEVLRGQHGSCAAERSVGLTGPRDCFSVMYFVQGHIFSLACRLDFPICPAFVNVCALTSSDSRVM